MTSSQSMRQKKDPAFAGILNDVRLAKVSSELIAALEERVIDVPITDKYQELESTGKNPVCLFPTRKQCEKVNDDMIKLLGSEQYEIPCIDEVDGTTTEKRHLTAAKRLEEPNKDCNNTAGLEAVIKLAVGARVMLRRNLDVKGKLVNGAIGTVCGIYPTRISVKFDHISTSCDIEKQRSKFMVMKNYYVYRTQFPLILAYAVTIHKCQGLTLDCAIIDLSNKVFAWLILLCPGWGH